MVKTIETVLTAMEGVAKRSLRYSRAASILSALEVALLASAVLATVAYAAFCGACWAPAAGLAAAAFVANKLSGYFYRRALKELDRLETLAVIMALSAGFTDKAEEMLKEKLEELKRGD